MLCFSVAIFGICRARNLKNIFFLSFSFAFGWFCLGLYWISNAFFVKSGFYIFLMPIAVAILPLFLSLIWSLAFIATKFISEKIGEFHINIMIFCQFLSI